MTATNPTERQLVRTALVGLVGMAALVALALNIQRLPLVGGGETYRAEFTDASGLAVGEEVRVAGLKVGSVTDIELGDERVIVTFQVEGVELGNDTRAGIEVKTLLGQHFLSLTPTGPGELDEEATIPLSRTSTPMNIVPVFQRLTTQAEELDTQQLNQAFDTLTTVLDETAPEVNGTLTGLARLSRSVSSRDGQIRELFSRASDVSGVVADRDRELAELLTDTTQVLDVLDQRRTTITRIIKGTSDLAEQLSGLVKDNRAEVRPALIKLNGVLDVLKQNKGEIDAILRNAAVYGREFANVGGSGRWFDASIKVPRGQALCDNGSTPLLGSLLAPILGALNQMVNGSRRPCLPLGPATGGGQQ